MPAGSTYALTPTEHVTVCDAGPDALLAEVVYGPGGSPPPRHLHPGQDERFEVLDGQVTVRVGGEERTLAAGDVLEIPRGTKHQMWNPYARPARVSWETRPALRTEEWWAALDGAKRRDPVTLGRLLLQYRDVFRVI